MPETFPNHAPDESVTEVKVEGAHGRRETAAVIAAVILILALTAGLVRLRTALRETPGSAEAGNTAPHKEEIPAAEVVPAAGVLRIGVTNLAYYSWAVNVAGDAAKVVPLLPSAVYHRYEPTPQDMERLHSVDVLIYNDAGGEEFVRKMLTAAAKPGLHVVDLHKGVQLVPFSSLTQRHAEEGDAEHDHTHDTGTSNFHTFIGIETAIAQVCNIRDELSLLLPARKAELAANAALYIARLRRLKSAALDLLKDAPQENRRLAAVHDAYAYLFEDLGLTLAAVIEPASAVKPSASELARAIERLRELRVRAILVEADVENKYGVEAAVALGLAAHPMKHITGGKYTPQRFLDDMVFNVSSLIAAVTGKNRAEVAGVLRTCLQEGR